MASPNYLEDQHKNRSSARLIGVFVIVNLVGILWACVAFGFKNPEYFTAAVGTGTTLFGVGSGTIFAYLYGNKRAELQYNPKDPNS